MARNRYLLPLALLLALLSVSAGRKSRTLVSFHIEAEKVESEVDTQGKFIIPLTLGNPPTTYFFHKVPELTSRQVEGFYAFPSRTGIGYGAAFKLDAQGRNRLLSVTTQNSGKRLLTTVNAGPNARPVNFVIIDKSVSHGYIVVWSGLKEADIALFRESIPEIVPNAAAGGDEDWGDAGDGGAGAAADAGKGKKAKKRGLFGGLFKGKKKEPDAPSADEGSVDDFAPPPN